MRPLVFALATCTVATWAGASLANGRFPYANHVVVDPSDGKHTLVRTTYGLIQTFDDGATWTWLCEKSVGYGGSFDPAVAVTGSGRTLAGLFEGLAGSPDRGCSFALAREPVLAGQFVIDLVVQSTAPEHVLALTSTGAADGFNVVVAESKDGGATWGQMGAALAKDFNSETLEIAPSRPQRVYASGIAGTPSAGVIFATDDTGATWERRSFDLKGGLAPYLAAVDPNDPQVVYLRLDGKASEGQGDSLWVSRDGARTWSKLGETTGEMLGFALSPDGSKVAFGGPTDGVWLASAPTFAPAKVANVGARCLGWAKAGLYACGTEALDGFTVGRSTDDGKTWTALHHQAKLSPQGCATGTTTGDLCAAEWPAVQATLGADVDAGPPKDAGTTPDGGGVSGGTTGDGRCGCGLGRPADGRLAALGLLAFGALAWRRGKRCADAPERD